MTVVSVCTIQQYLLSAFALFKTLLVLNMWVLSVPASTNSGCYHHNINVSIIQYSKLNMWVYVLSNNTCYQCLHHSIPCANSAWAKITSLKLGQRSAPKQTFLGRAQGPLRINMLHLTHITKHKWRYQNDQKLVLKYRSSVHVVVIFHRINMIM